MHSANTLMANIIPYAERMKLGKDDIVLMASPLAHQTGFMYGLMMPIMLRASVVLQDVWDPAKATGIIRDEGVTFTMASTPFLTDLTRAVSETGKGVPSLKTFLCAGAPIPGPLVEQARATLGAKIVSAWGMTENGAVTLIKLDDDKNVEQRCDQHDGRHHQPEEQEGDVGCLTTIARLHEQRSRLLLAYPFIQIESIDNRLHVLLGRTAQAYPLAAGEPLALALPDLLALERHRFHALGQRIGGDQRHGQRQHGCGRRDGGEQHRKEMRVLKLCDQQLKHGTFR